MGALDCHVKRKNCGGSSIRGGVASHARLRRPARRPLSRATLVKRDESAQKSLARFVGVFLYFFVGVTAINVEQWGRAVVRSCSILSLAGLGHAIAPVEIPARPKPNGPGAAIQVVSAGVRLLDDPVERAAFEAEAPC